MASRVQQTDSAGRFIPNLLNLLFPYASWQNVM